MVLDAAQRDTVAHFWSDLLALPLLDRDYPATGPIAPGAPGLAFQQCRPPESGRNRFHIDLAVDDLEEATDRVVAAGGSLVREVLDGDHPYRVMLDPEGNEFCLSKGLAGPEDPMSPSE
ncbi:VOC family protein [Streptomyces sp. NPDC004647]|uniref:VOC family protein n=1 Tax=Streptomyces sp. NPDC004647 TaxID=3154671 RepID=UPI0033B00BAB